MNFSKPIIAGIVAVSISAVFFIVAIGLYFGGIIGGEDKTGVKGQQEREKYFLEIETQIKSAYDAALEAIRPDLKIGIGPKVYSGFKKCSFEDENENVAICDWSENIKDMPADPDLLLRAFTAVSLFSEMMIVKKVACNDEKECVERIEKCMGDTDKTVYFNLFKKGLNIFGLEENDINAMHKPPIVHAVQNNSDAKKFLKRHFSMMRQFLCSLSKSDVKRTEAEIDNTLKNLTNLDDILQALA